MSSDETVTVLVRKSEAKSDSELKNRRSQQYTCPTCGHTFSSHVYVTHTKRCPLLPENKDKVMALLRRPDLRYVAVTSNTYRENATNTDAPSYRTLMAMYGSWESVAAAFGLITEDQIEEAIGEEIDEEMDANRAIQRTWERGFDTVSGWNKRIIYDWERRRPCIMAAATLR